MAHTMRTAHGSLEKDLYRDIHYLAGHIGERHTRRVTQLRRAQQFIEDALSSAGLSIHRQTYQVVGQPCSNVIGEIRPRATEKEIVVFGAHYDSVPGSPGANDNASGVAALLSLARLLNGRELGRTVRLVAFVNEERPYLRTPRMGSYVYASECRQRAEPIVAMMSLETVGYYPALDPPAEDPAIGRLLRPFQGNFLAVVGDLRSRRLVHRISTILQDDALFPVRRFCLPRWLPGVKSSDHWAFWKHGYPACMLTDTAPLRYPFYHRAGDTPDRLSYRALSEVVAGLEQVALQLASPRVCR
jgi:Zn-dependent M28 family amino/carboxypeptidase